MIQSLTELVEALESGQPLEKRFTVRTVSIPEPPKYSAKAIRALRMKLGLSQSLFAALMGVSNKLVEHWEGGVRKPSAMACRLFDSVAQDPSRFIIRTQSKPAA